MTTQTTTTTVDSRTGAYGTTPVSWWGWPDEASLANFAEQAGEADRMEQAEQPVENDMDYAALYFGS